MGCVFMVGVSTEHREKASDFVRCWTGIPTQSATSTACRLAANRLWLRRSTGQDTGDAPASHRKSAALPAGASRLTQLSPGAVVNLTNRGAEDFVRAAAPVAPVDSCCCSPYHRL